ncbi:MULTISPECIES: GNAT family N-acetyltransferase [unclassified Sporolactobacillus]|uniref:GNAT family N-acetyltransferase n=1 Tax=unclassified Sporolactobacillus TaxID=2628533 RepID=UPI002368F0A3|nr:GNAT family N-acetyltransferase [Sporolactobacillus sp. CQH2019]MDD9146931.1 GNAT family N-acetyltransferase [Sporolactobacillus sp. CQH2019]
MDIREMVPGDYEGAYDLWSRVPGMNLRSLDNSYEGIARIIRKNPETCFVAVENGRIVGTILGGTDGRKGFIYHTAVDPVYRGRRIGTLLIDRVCENFRKEKITKIGLFVVLDNEDGKSFWRKKGWNFRPDIVYLDKDL